MEPREQKLNELRQELEARLSRYEAHQHRNDPMSKQFHEQALTRQTDEVVESLEQQTRNELADIDRALARIKQGVGDQCASCGQPIQAERLASIPYSVNCIKCASKQ